jgi:protein-tyrosine-phosphatase
MPPQTVLLLCTRNYFRSRFAEILLNHLAAKFGLAGKVSLRARATEPATWNVGPMAVVAIKAMSSWL